MNTFTFNGQFVQRVDGLPIDVTTVGKVLDVQGSRALVKTMNESGTFDYYEMDCDNLADALEYV